MKNKFSWLKKNERILWLEYSVLALVIMTPMFLPGYILTLDLVFTPHMPFPSEVTSVYPLELLLWIIHWVLPGDVLEKILLCLILVLSGVGMHQLVHYLRPKEMKLEYWHIASYFAGVFYMINPFTYARFMAGQWLVLFGYALLPFFVAALLRLLYHPTRRQALKLGILAATIAAVSIHHVGMMVLLAVITLSAALFRYQHKGQNIQSFLICAFISVGVFLVSSLYWILPVIFGNSSLATTAASFNAAQFSAFQTEGGTVIGRIGEVLRLQGFWVEGRDLFVLPQAIVPLWGVVVLFLWILVVMGIKKAFTAHKLIVGFAICCTIIGTLLAATPIIEWLSNTMPFMRGYREPHKFTNLIALGFALLGAFGVGYSLQAIHRRYKEKGVKLFAVLCLALPIVITPVMFWGFAGQLQPQSYPREWYEMNSYLKKVEPKGKTVFLPWHQYARYSFSNRTIANPAEKFFEVPMVISDDPEFKGVAPTAPNEEKRYVTELLKSKENIAAVSRAGIEYILVAKEQDYRQYDYLKQQRDISVVKEDDKFVLYRVEK